MGEEVAFDILEAFSENGSSAAIGPHEGSVRLAVAEDTIEEAISMATELKVQVQEVLGDVEVTSFTVMSEQEFKDSLDAPDPLDLVGLTEIAGILGVSRQRANAIVKLDGFPRVLVDVAAGKLRSRGEVLDWFEQWDRKPGRRS